MTVATRDLVNGRNGVDDLPAPREVVERMTAKGGSRAPRIEQVLRATKPALDALAADERIARRLTLTPTRIQIRVGRRRTVDWRLERDRIEVTLDDRGYRPEVRVDLTTRQLHDIWLGRFSLPLGIVRGEVRYQGPVRHLLRILPIVSAGSDEYLRRLKR